MTEMTGIEMIQVLMKEVALLQKKVDLLDLNLKRLLNQNRPKPKIKPVEPPKIEDQKGIKKFKFESDKLKTSCICEGKMVINNGGKQTPLPGLDVKIYDSQNNNVKSTRTNKSGTWVSHLPVGRYVAEIQGKYGNKSLYPVNITFEVLPGMERLEVK